MAPLQLQGRSRKGSVRQLILFCLAAILLPLCLWAAAPGWWAERGVLNPSATADDYAAVNQGQVKNIAKQAYEEFKAKLSGGAGATLDAIWATPAASADDYQAINLGQLKNVAEPFYARLAEVSYTGQPLASGQTRPWSGTADDYALANIGQVKNLFSFIIPLSASFDDDDSDGMSNEWEIAHGLNPSSPANAGDAELDADQDGITNLAEFQAGLNMFEADSNELGLVIYTP